MKKILVLAYAVSPTKGSEYSVSWNFITQMSKDYELTVLFGTSGLHLGDVEEMEVFTKDNSVPNVTFIPIKANEKAEKLNALNKRGIFVYSFYRAFNEWHKQVYEYAENLMKKEHFDVVHYITPIGYREPGYLWKLNMPYVWGPIGGTYSVPLSLLQALKKQGKLKLGFRKVANFLQLKYKKSLKQAFSETDVLVAATTYDQKILSKEFNRKIYYLPENGITHTFDLAEKKFDTDILHLIWIGSIDERKALIILLKALTKISRKNIHLDIVGEGILKDSLFDFAKKHNISNLISWHGAVPRNQVMNMLSKAQLHIITSLTEANTTVIWESMSHRVPTMSLDHCGMHDVICEECGIKIKINSFETVIEDIATKLDFYNQNRDQLKKLSDGTVICGEKFKWENRIEFWNERYDEAINIFKNRK